MRTSRRNLPSIETQIVSLRGGLDLSSPFALKDPGSALSLINFVPVLGGGGYRRWGGFERTDGRLLPSRAVYYTISVGDGSAINVGDTLTGETSGAESVVVIKDGDLLGVTAMQGEYIDGEIANGTEVLGAPVLSGQPDMDNDDVWQLAAENYYRSLISAAPGDGAALYAFHYQGDYYAFREDGGTVKMYKSSQAGWQAVPFGHVLAWDTGVMAEGSVSPGDTIIGATSAAEAVVTRFIKNGGSYEDDASGYMVLEMISGAFEEGEDLELESVVVAKAAGGSYQIELQPGGYFQHVSHNFYGSAATQRVYGCDGVNPAWEFDGETLLPILFPGADYDAEFNCPSLIAVHRTYLFLLFRTGQMAHSAPGEPAIFSALMGAEQFGLGDVPTGVAARSGNVLAIYTEGMTYGLYGKSAEDWDLAVISESFGAIKHTVQKVGTVYALDEKGIAPLERVDAYGDFESATVSRKVFPTLQRYHKRVIASVAAKQDNQYRLYFDDGSVMVMCDDKYMSESDPAFSMLQLPFTPTFVSSSDAPQGQIILMGDADGMIYRSESGYNFDGEELEYSGRLPFAHQGMPQVRKSYRRLYIDLDSPRSVRFYVSVDLAYGQPEIPSPLGGEVHAETGGGYWDVDQWDEFFWDAANFASQGVSLSGTANNISILFYGNSKTTRPFTLQTYELHFLRRRVRRGR